MLILDNRLIGMPIMSIQTGGRLGNTTRAIIDPRRLRVVAFYCEGPVMRGGPEILHSDDIREVSSIGLIVDSTDSIMPADDLVRLKEVLDFKFELDGKPVVDEAGHKLGKVASYSVDATTFYIIKLHVQPGFLRSLQTSELIIDRSQVVEITSKQVVVKAAAKDEKAAEPKAMPAINNPFRKSSPQPDTTVTEEPV